METYVAFLRGINVGGKNKIPMLALRLSLQSAGLNNVRTYIQSGNIVFESALVSAHIISTVIENAIKNTFDLDIPVLVKRKNELKKIVSDSPYKDVAQSTGNKTYFVLFFEMPNESLIEIFKILIFPNEKFQTSEGCIHLLCENGYGKAKLNNNFVESKLKVIATARNYRTILKVLELAQ